MRYGLWVTIYLWVCGGWALTLGPTFNLGLTWFKTCYTYSWTTVESVSSVSLYCYNCMLCQWSCHTRVPLSSADHIGASLQNYPNSDRSEVLYK